MMRPAHNNPGNLSATPKYDSWSSAPRGVVKHMIGPGSRETNPRIPPIIKTRLPSLWHFHVTTCHVSGVHTHHAFFTGFAIGMHKRVEVQFHPVNIPNPSREPSRA